MIGVVHLRNGRRRMVVSERGVREKTTRRVTSQRISNQDMEVMLSTIT
jgi:hypothetical protein